MTRRFQFSLRALLAGIVVLTAPIAWVAHNAHMVRERREMLDHFSGRLFIVDGLVEEPVSVPGIRRMLGDRPIPALLDDLAIPDGGQVQRLRKLFPEAKILVKSDPEMDGRWRRMRPVSKMDEE